jgi:hypothetical protein
MTVRRDMPDNPELRTLWLRIYANVFESLGIHYVKTEFPGQSLQQRAAEAADEAVTYLDPSWSGGEVQYGSPHPYEDAFKGTVPGQGT